MAPPCASGGILGSGKRSLLKELDGIGLPQCYWFVETQNQIKLETID